MNGLSRIGTARPTNYIQYIATGGHRPGSRRAFASIWKQTRSAPSDISFDIRRGSAVALVGRSGAGKSTIADLIFGVLVPSSGAVLVNGTDIQTNVRAWQRHIGYVPQSIFLLAGSIRSNIAFGHRAQVDVLVAA